MRLLRITSAIPTGELRLASVFNTVNFDERMVDTYSFVVVFRNSRDTDDHHRTMPAKFIYCLGN